MPQTLSLIGRGHVSAQNYVGLNTQNVTQQQQQQQANNQAVSSNQTASNQDQTYATRHVYSGTQQHGTIQVNTHVPSSTIYQSQNSPNSTSSIHGSSGGNNFGNPIQRYSQIQPLTSPTSSIEQTEKIKFQEKNQEKFDHTLSTKHEQQRYESSLTFKYDSHQMKCEQHGKYEQSSNQPATKLYEQSSKHELSGNQTNKYDSATKLEQGKYESGQSKHEQHHGTKYDPNQNIQQYKHDSHETRPSVKYEHNPVFKFDSLNKYDVGAQQFKQSEPAAKYENNQNKLEQSCAMKHDQNGKPFEFERLKNDNERKNLVEVRAEDKTKPALPPKPSKPNPPPRLTHHDKLVDTSADGIGDCKNTIGTSLRSVFSFPFR